jgi:integration host factor subunit alpha
MKQTTLTRADIVDSLAREVTLPRHRATDFLEAAIEILSGALVSEGLIKLSSFGSFNVRNKSKRVGRNPKTGKEAVITPRKVISFTPSHYLRDKVQRRKA